MTTHLKQHSDIDTETKSRQGKSVRHRAMDLLARREHSRLELKRKLLTKGFEADAIEACIEELVADGLLSDIRFAEAYINHRSQRGFGPHRIRQELRERGVIDTHINLALEEATIDWDGLAEQCRQKKFGVAQPDDYDESARQRRFLQYRGF